MTWLSGALRTAALGFVLSLAGVSIGNAATLPPAPVPVASFDAGSLHVDQFGNGPQTLVLIPGLGSGPWAWYGTIAHFSPNYTIYAVTLPGFDGRAACAKTPLFSTFSADFWQMLADRKIDKPVLVGHSLGGTLAFLLAEEHPERLRGIVAVDGLPIFPMLANATPEQRAAAGAQMAASIAAATPSQSLAYETQYMSKVWTIDPALVAPTAQLEVTSDPKAVAAWLQEDLTNDLRPNLSKIAVPVLEVMPYNPADAKPPMNYTQAQTLAFYESLLAGAPKARVEAIAPSRHFAMLDQPDAFYALLTQFLGSLQ